MGKSKKKKGKKLPKSLRKGALPKPVDAVLAAGVGALARAQKKGAGTFDTLVQRGERVTKDGGDAARDAMSDVEAAVAQIVEDARSRAGGAADSLQGRFEAVVEVALGAAGVAGRGDVDALRQRIDALQDRIGTLAGAGAGATDGEAERPAARFEVRPHPDGWAVQAAGADEAAAVLGTKKEAVRDARKLAKEHAPSTLTVRKLDGTVADVSVYGVD